MIRTLKLFINLRNYRDVASLWLIGSMLAILFGTLLGVFGIMIQWIATLPTGAVSGLADFIVFLLYSAGLYGGPGWGGDFMRVVATAWPSWRAVSPP